MRAPAAVAASAVLLLGGACGGGSTEDEVRSAWETASHAAADGDATAFCDAVAEEGKREITRQTGMSCEDTVRLLVGRLDGEEKATIRDAQITEVELRGDEATVSYDTTGALSKVGFTGRTSMIRVDGRWLLRGI